MVFLVYYLHFIIKETEAQRGRNTQLGRRRAEARIRVALKKAKQNPCPGAWPSERFPLQGPGTPEGQRGDPVASGPGQAGERAPPGGHAGHRLLRASCRGSAEPPLNAPPPSPSTSPITHI